jgi:hypothetical protein
MGHKNISIVDSDYFLEFLDFFIFITSGNHYVNFLTVNRCIFGALLLLILIQT